MPLAGHGKTLGKKNMENDSITKFNDRSPVVLSEAKLTAIQNWREQPTQYYSTLPTSTPRKMIDADTPNLWELRSQIGHPATIAILVKAFIHAARLVNLDKNISPEQMGEAANDILEYHGQLKVEEVKYLLKRAIRTEKLYGRLDYNMIMNWVEAYDSERTEEAVRSSEQKESQERNDARPSPGAMSYREWLDDLEERALTDQEAATLLEQIKNPPPRRFTLLTREERTKRDHDFKMWKTFQYLLNKD